MGWNGRIPAMTIIIGVLHVNDGLIGIMKDRYYLVYRCGGVFWGDQTGRGRSHLILGVLVVVAGAWPLSGRMWAAR
jgi:hypothetical protein